MTAQATEPPGFGPQHNSFRDHSSGSYLIGSLVLGGEPVIVDPYARELEMPWASLLFEHLRAVAADGGIVYLTRHGRRVLAVVPADVAQSLQEEHSARDRLADLQDLLDDSEARLGPVPAEVAEEVDRQWRAVAAL